MFQHLWAIVLGGLAVGLPVLVHWLTRPRPVRLPTSTLRFLREALQQRRARHRLRDIIILSLRTLAVAMLALALARPLTKDSVRKSVAEDDADTIRVVLVDASQSMAARAGGIALFERARSLAAEKLEYQPGLSANLILAGARPQSIFERPSTNFSALNEELSQARPLPEELDVRSALNLAAEMLTRGGDAPGVQRELVVVSDFQRNNWANADFSVLPEDTAIQLQSVAPEKRLANLGILSVETRGRAEAGHEVHLEAVVGNDSTTPRNVRVELSLGDAVHILQGTCAPESRTTLTGDVLVRAVGWQTGEAKLVGVADSLPDDDVRPFALQVRPPPRYVVITRQLPNEKPSSSYFLERGLLPSESESIAEGSRLVRLSPDDVAAEELGRADLIVVDHAGRISQESIHLLAALLRRGRGMLYVASEPIDATNLKLLSDAVGPGLELPVDFLPPQRGEERRGLMLSEPRSGRAPFSIFGDNLKAAIAPLRFSGGLSTRVRDGALADDILATYSDGSACLVVAAADAGALAVLNDDLGHSNLYQSPIYVPLLGELVQQYLLSRRQGAREVACGEELVAELPSEAGAIAGMELRGPDPAVTEVGRLQQESQGVLWTADRLSEPGVYRVVRDGQTVFAVTAAAPAAESDLRVLPPDVFRERLAGGRSVEFRASGGGNKEETDWLWTWMAIACVGCLMGETVSLKYFRT